MVAGEMLIIWGVGRSDCSCAVPEPIPELWCWRSLSGRLVAGRAPKSGNWK